MPRVVRGSVIVGLLFLSMLLPLASPSADSSEGVLFVDVPEGTPVAVLGVGSYDGPLSLELPAGEYTIRVEDGITIIASVFVNSGNVTVLHVDPKAIAGAVSGSGISSARVVFNESANYSSEKLNPPFDPFFFPGGCGGNFGYINISKPYPMSFLVRGREEVYITLNGTFMHIGDDDGKPCVSYVDVVPGVSNRIEGVRNATYIVPWARLEINSTPEDLTIYINGGHNRYIFYTPMGFYVPAIPHDVYNATAVSGFHGTIRIPVIHKLDAHTVGIADDHYLVESVVRVTPGGTYHVNVNMEKVESALWAERKSQEDAPTVIEHQAKEGFVENQVELSENSIASQDFEASDIVATAFTMLSHWAEFAL